MEFLSLVSFCGFIAVALFLYKTALVLHSIFFPFFIAQPKNLKKLAGARWAVITGSTDGIGKAYAFELAARGFDLVLISRTQSKLDQTADEIRQKSQVEIKTIAFDFSKADFDEYEQKLLSVLKSMEIGVLGELTSLSLSIVCSVNNVGMSYEYPERLDQLEGGLKRVSDITVMNTLPVTLLSATVLSQMAQRNAGVVVNLSSSAAYHPMYYWAIYSATKKYVNWLSSILRKEYAQTNIVIQTVCPMMVATKMSKIRKTSLTIPTPSVYAKSAVNSIGLVDETTGCWPHELQSTLYFGVLPSWIIEKFVNQNSIATRKRALKKKSCHRKGRVNCDLLCQLFCYNRVLNYQTSKSPVV
ncbi:17beta-hydroxysteroid dehydrogenase [Aphelenchoides besseyi]|nr:17beta-hydroxysteroid dehydrogenase [Aphelenchoides besseyi]